MLSQNQAKTVTALQVKKYRQKYRKFVVEGDKMVVELIRQRRIGLDSIFCLESWEAENRMLLKPFLHQTSIVSEVELKKISSLQTPNKVLAIADLPDEKPDFQSLGKQFSIYLDGIQDPGNLGTILRTADWFGIPAVFCSPDSVDAFNSKVVQSSMGALLRVQVFELELVEILPQMPGLPVLGAVMDGEDVFRAELPKMGLIVIGNEGRGISSEARKHLTHRLAIPRDPAGQAESLNAAVAAGILTARLKNH